MVTPGEWRVKQALQETARELGVPLEVRARATEIKGRKVVVAATLSAEGEVCAWGEVVAVQMPEHMMPGQAQEGQGDLR